VRHSDHRQKTGERRDFPRLQHLQHGASCFSGRELF
jgi:hypothetical protein